MAKEFKHDSVGTQLTQNEYESTTGHVIASQAVGDIVYASTTSQLTGLAIGEQNQILTVSSAGIPEWATSITLGDGDAEDVAVIIDGNAVDFHIGLDDSADDLVIGTGSTLGTATAISIDGGGTLATTFYGDVTLGGTTPTLTIGDAGAEDTAIVFDGNAQDFYIGLDDSADDLIIGLGNTVGTTPAISIDENRNVTFSDGSIDIDIASHDTSNGLKLGGTLVTSTAAELNILDGVTSTATELNIMDGDTSVGTSTVADGDGIVTNDGGTMKQTTVQTFATYFADEITAMSNLVTTGALNSGSITSGFGSINIGSSTLTTSGTTDLGATTVDSLSVSDANITNVGDIALDSISADGNDINIAMTDNRSTALTIKESTNSYLTFITTNSSEKIQVHQALDIDAASDFGSNAMTNVNIDSGAIDGVTLGSNSAITTATIDNVIINGTTIGHTDDTDLITLADGIATVAGEVSMTTLDIGGTNVTATAAELNLLDGGTSVGGSITLADSDGVVVNDGGTMKTIPASDVKTYVGAGDITGVTAGDGISGGGTSGGVTVAVDLGTNSGLEISSNKLQIAKGIDEHDTAQFGAGVADGDFLKISTTSVVGRSTSEVLSDIGAQASLTFGISNTNAVKIDAADVADDEYARFTANGLESRTAAEVAADIGPSVSDLHGAGVDGSANQLLTDDGDGTVTSESNLTFDGSTLTVTGDLTPSGTITVADGKDVHLDSTQTDNNYSGVTATFSNATGSTISKGKAVYISGDNQIALARANADSTMPAIGIAIADIANSGTGKVLLSGFIHDADILDCTIGGEMYVSEDTAGALTKTLPASSGDRVQVVGVGLHADKMFFNPSYDIVERG